MSNATPWRGGDALFTRRTPNAPDRPKRGDWDAPTGDTQHLIVVGRHEMTCLACGETFGNATPVTGEATFCWRCGGRVGVPTISYLQPHEYREVC